MRNKGENISERLNWSTVIITAMLLLDFVLYFFIGSDVSVYFAPFLIGQCFLGIGLFLAYSILHVMIMLRFVLGKMGLILIKEIRQIRVLETINYFFLTPLLFFFSLILLAYIENTFLQLDVIIKLDFVFGYSEGLVYLTFLSFGIVFCTFIYMVNDFTSGKVKSKKIVRRISGSLSVLFIVSYFYLVFY